MGWICNRVSVRDYLQYLKGKFAGCSYNCGCPVARVFPNNPSCKQFTKFISQAIMDRIKVGAVGVVGRVHDCPPPCLVMPLTVEPNRPRLWPRQRQSQCLCEVNALMSSRSDGKFHHTCITLLGWWRRRK
jgi:hypothetical protein